MSKCDVPSLKKNSAYTADMKTFYKELIYTFFRSNVLVFSLYTGS